MKYNDFLKKINEEQALAASNNADTDVAKTDTGPVSSSECVDLIPTLAIIAKNASFAIKEIDRRLKLVNEEITKPKEIEGKEAKKIEEPKETENKENLPAKVTTPPEQNKVQIVNPGVNIQAQDADSVQVK